MSERRRHAAFWSSLLAVVIGAVVPSAGLAHESRPAYLELTEQAPGMFDVLWRRPARGDRVLGLKVVLPDHCAAVGQRAFYRMPGSSLERWTVACGTTGLVGHRIEIGELETTLTDVLVRVTLNAGLTHTRILRPNASWFTVERAPSTREIVRDYCLLGIEHILGGIDHLLFVLGLLLLVRGRWRLVKTITAFTVAHSITLGAATLGLVRVPQAPVEAVIALSILFLATELAKRRVDHPGLTERYPWVVAFVFGLLHGFGFAGALAEVGLPQAEIPVALLMFNVGVEVGQLLFIGGVLAVGSVARYLVGWRPHWMPQALAYGIGSISAYWVLARIAAS